MSTILELLAAAARGVSGNGPALDTELFEIDGDLRLELEVTAVAGTAPTLDVKLQDSFDGVDWNDVAGGAFAQKVAAGREALNVSGPFARYVRVAYTIGGSAGQSFTFDVKLAA